MQKCHKTTEIRIGGTPVSVDAEIAQLIRLMNRVPGLETLNSCQGDFGPGYVQFRDNGKKGSTGASVRFLQRVVELMDTEAKKHWLLEHHFVSVYGPRNGTKGFSLYFTVEMGHGYVMRWLPDTFPVLTDIVRRIVQSKQTGKSLETAA